jgi:hypothetical protein
VTIISAGGSRNYNTKTWRMVLTKFVEIVLVVAAVTIEETLRERAVASEPNGVLQLVKE